MSLTGCLLRLSDRLFSVLKQCHPPGSHIVVTDPVGDKRGQPRELRSPRQLVKMDFEKWKLSLKKEWHTGEFWQQTEFPLFPIAGRHPQVGFTIAVIYNQKVHKMDTFLV